MICAYDTMIDELCREEDRRALSGIIIDEEPYGGWL
jgi:hypothetical protein